MELSNDKNHRVSKPNLINNDAYIGNFSNYPELKSLPIELASIVIQQFDQEFENSYEINDPPILLKNALLLIRNNELDLAQNLLRAMLDKDPLNLKAIQWMGFTLMKKNHWDEALQCYLVLAQINPDILNLSLVGEIYYRQGHDVEAKNYYTQALKFIDHSHPILFEIYKNLGNIYVKEGDLEAAEENYNKAYTICPNSDVLLVNYGTLEIQKENYVKAENHFRAAIAINEKNDKAWVGLSLLYREKGDIELARANVERSLDLNPNNETALKLYVEWTMNGSYLDSVIDRLQVYLGNNDQNAQMAFVLAKVLVTVGRLSQAAIEMERVLALQPEIEGGVQVMNLIKEHLKKREVGCDRDH